MTNTESKIKRIITDFPYSVTVEENVWITMQDGTRLAARIWLPQTNQVPVPGILEYIPYRKRDGTRGRDEPMHGYFSGHGYAVVRVDMRGSGESDGLLKDEYLKQEQDDALEVIDWISRQSWCDGKVGMMGKSWGGFNSLQVAARRPPALRAIITVGFTDDRYNNDIHYKGGCLLNDNFWWGSIMFAYMCRPPEPILVGKNWKSDWLKRLEEMPMWPALWLEHQTRDSYWKHGSVCENYEAIQVPVFAVDGWADSYTNTVLSLMAGLTVPRKGLIGPWAHLYAHDGIPGPAIGFLQEAKKWWDYWLKGIHNDIMDGQMINVYMEESMLPNSAYPFSRGRWVGLNSWPTEEVLTKKLYMVDGKLTEKASVKEASILIKTPQNHGLLAGEWMGAGVAGESPCDQRLDDGMAITFTSEPLEEPLEILGYPEFVGEMTCDESYAMLFAQISDVFLDGAVARVTYGVMNLSHLEGHDKVVPLRKGEKVKAHVSLDCCAHRFEKGHRIRLSLATTFWPMFWNMPKEAALTLKLQTAELILPEFHGKDAKGPDMQPESASPTPMTLLSEGRVDRSIAYDIVTDTWTCITNGIGGVFGEGIYRFDEIDTTVEHDLKRELVLSNQNPLSAVYTIRQKMKIGRDGWMIDADIVTTQKADIKNFYLTATMDVKENEKIVFQKEWKKTVKRSGL
jgi:uncharacterized protein